MTTSIDDRINAMQRKLTGLEEQKKRVNENIIESVTEMENEIIEYENQFDGLRVRIENLTAPQPPLITEEEQLKIEHKETENDK